MGLAEDLSAGSIGFFWHIPAGLKPDLGSEPHRGHVRTDGAWALVETLEEDAEEAWLREDDPPEIEGIAAALATSSALLLEVQDNGYSTNIGGWRASIRRHRARTVVAPVPFDRLRTVKASSLQAHFFGVSKWAGMTAATESVETDAGGRGKSWSMRLESPPPQRSRLVDRRALVLQADWAAKGPHDQRTVTAPVAISCESKVPRRAWDLLEPLLRVQDLLSFIHGGFVAADTGTATLDLRSDSQRPQGRSTLWNGALMVPSPAAPALPSNPIPYLDVATMGGAPGLSRWVNICLNHPRAVRPFLTPYRYGSPPPELALMETATGIEYWVNANRKHSWADKARGPHAAALGRHVGVGFTQWIGNTPAWAEEFRQTNNGLKHNPASTFDPNVISDLALSGRLLLAAAILDGVARNHQPSRSIFNSFRIYALRDRLRARYAP